MKFSVLISIYHKESPLYFNQAMKSIWDNQTLKPTEIILVEDGKLTDELYKELDKWESKLGLTLKRVSLSENQGLAKALNEGLQYCTYEYIARMDTDDICTPDRFEKQVAFLRKNPDIDILGGQISEFNQYVGDIDSFRKLPEDHDKLVAFAKKRCPLNHPAIIYKKSIINSVGGYQNNYLYEDYALWVRVINQGAKIANLPDIVLYMRAGDAMSKRRGGIKYAISEAQAQYNFYKIGFLSVTELVRNLIIRLPVRLIPSKLRALIYKQFLR